MSKENKVNPSVRVPVDLIWEHGERTLLDADLTHYRGGDILELKFRPISGANGIKPYRGYHMEIPFAAIRKLVEKVDGD